MIIFAGGYGCRAKLGQVPKEFKELEISEFNTTTLFEKIITKIDHNWNIVVYVICSRKNCGEIIDFVENKLNVEYP